MQGNAESESDMNKVFKENLTFVLMVLSSFVGFIIYAEKRLEQIETNARTELKEQTNKLQDDLKAETNARREDIREMNQKLDKLIFMVSRISR